MPKKSAGILLYRISKGKIEVLLVHPGGPFWAKKDAGAWSIPKGEFDDGESPLDAAIRETHEELGIKVEGDFIELTPIKQKSGKTIFPFAIEHQFDPSKLQSNSFEMEWPLKSGQKRSFPEVDKAEWFSFDIANEKINNGQKPFLAELLKKLE